jgi:hypothetical protein
MSQKARDGNTTTERSVELLSPIFKIFAVRAPHWGFDLDHPGAFLLVSGVKLESHREDLGWKWFVGVDRFLVTNSSKTRQWCALTRNLRSE